jgi:phospholipid/cholesterol/gamma-HCH transport system ATP-binding protein
MPGDHLVEIRNLEFAYGARKILTGIDMTMERGQVVAIMGGSGCGKTTLLKLISGMLRPTSGEVLVKGDAVHRMDTTGLARHRRKLGVLFQFGALFTDLSVFDNVAFPLREHTDLPETLIRDLVLLKLHSVGLRAAHTLMPHQLSGGMARRVALARAIALDPALVLFDEPFTGLDPISLTVTGNLIRRLTDTLGMTSVVVTHDVAESLKIVDKVFFIADGRIAASGTPDEVRHTTDPFVHQFIYGEEDGPMRFHFPGGSMQADFGLEGGRA